MQAPDTPALYTIHIAGTGEQCDAWATDTLLDSIEMGSLQWPSSCRNGACRTCLGKLQQGTVHYQVEWPSLTPEERAEGYVLPCVAYPDGDVTLEGPEN